MLKCSARAIIAGVISVLVVWKTSAVDIPRRTPIVVQTKGKTCQGGVQDGLFRLSITSRALLPELGRELSNGENILLLKLSAKNIKPTNVVAGSLNLVKVLATKGMTNF